MSLYGVIGYHVTLSEGHITPYKQILVPHLVATLIYLSQIDSYYTRGDMSPLILPVRMTNVNDNVSYLDMGIPTLVSINVYLMLLYCIFYFIVY